jgi:aspartyl-tRNA(Asn)/glutamyl-tRNA(Gln) amidotransferase subunit A
MGGLHGVPVGVKDIFDVGGWPTAAGSASWGLERAARDAEVVARLRTAGAVIVGKTVTTAYAWIDPPPTTNPWDSMKTPGGSSSGSAAALAAGMCLGALGSQTGGSITRPAAYCGLCGLKPTYGALSVDGVRPLAPSLDHPGALAGSIGDLMLVWRALRGEPAAERVAPVSIGRVRGLFQERATVDAIEAVDLFLEDSERAGARVVEHEAGVSFEMILREHRLILAAEAAGIHAARRRELPGEYPEQIGRLIDEGLAIGADVYGGATGRLFEARRGAGGLLDGVDVLATPAALGEAPDRSSTGDPAFHSPWSYLGLPTVCFPVALGSAGLPLGVQLVGRPGGEAALLAAARWCERVVRAS